MYPCPNCAAGLRFDIETQTLACDHCDSHFDPYVIGREKDAVEHNDFEVTVFTCPQCGGELISADDTIATFCSYCGGTTVLDSRIEKEKRPDKIITFKKTKADCKAAYGEFVKKAFYTPKEFRDPEQLEKFRGIYMPYWVYDFKTDASVCFDAKKSYREGDYDCVDRYCVYGHVSGEVNNIVYDASSKFYDNLSEGINPYNVDSFQKFTPSFFSGFYADCGDVDSAVYEDDACNLANRYNSSKVLCAKEALPLTVDSDNKGKLFDQTTPTETKTSIAMLPVWFLSYRTKDKKVAYAVVNGQTGKVAGDLPVDKKKFFGVSAIAALILFAIFSLFTMKPATILFTVLVISIIVFLISNSQMKKVLKKERLEDDQGVNYIRELQKEMEADKAAKGSDIPDMAVASEEEVDEYVKSRNRAIRCAAAVNSAEKAAAEKKGSCGGCFATIALCVAAIALTWIILPSIIGDLFRAYQTAENIIFLVGILLGLALCIVFMVNMCRTGNPLKNKRLTKDEKSDNGKKFLNKLKYWIVIAVSVVVLIVDPVEDFIYYGAVIFCIAMVIFSEIQLINRFNILATRKLPQLGRRGGDENA